MCHDTLMIAKFKPNYTGDKSKATLETRKQMNDSAGPKKMKLMLIVEKTENQSNLL